MAKVSKEKQTTVVPTPSKEEGKRREKEKTVKTDYSKKQGGTRG